MPRRGVAVLRMLDPIDSRRTGLRFIAVLDVMFGGPFPDEPMRESAGHFVDGAFLDVLSAENDLARQPDAFYFRHKDLHLSAAEVGGNDSARAPRPCYTLRPF